MISFYFYIDHQQHIFKKKTIDLIAWENKHYVVVCSIENGSETANKEYDFFACTWVSFSCFFSDEICYDRKNSTRALRQVPQIAKIGLIKLCLMGADFQWKASAVRRLF